MTAVTFDTLTKGLIRASSVILYAHDRDSRHRGKGVCTAGRGALADPCGITVYSLTRPDPFSARAAGITSAPCAFPPIPLFAQANYRFCPTGGAAGRWILASECREVYALADADRQARRDLAAPPSSAAPRPGRAGLTRRSVCPISVPAHARRHHRGADPLSKMGDESRSAGAVCYAPASQECGSPPGVLSDTINPTRSRRQTGVVSA